MDIRVKVERNQASKGTAGTRGKGYKDMERQQY